MAESNTRSKKVSEDEVFCEPEPLSFDYHKVVIDLDETLIENGSIRPGAMSLLDGLIHLDFRLVLVTTASQQWLEDFVGKYPQIMAKFEQVVSLDDLKKMNFGVYESEWMQAMRSYYGNDSEIVEQLTTILVHGGSTGKYPQTFGAIHLIDDKFNITGFGDIIQGGLGKYGYHGYNPRPILKEEESGGWANRVIKEVVEVTKRPQ